MGGAADAPGQRFWMFASLLGTALIIFTFSAAAFGAAIKFGRPVMASMAIAASYGFVLLAMVVEWPRVAEGLRRHWYVMVVPAFALLSFLWSEAPGHTLRMSLQLVMTVLAAIVLGAANSPRRLMRICRNVLGLAVLVSLLLILAGHPMAFDSNGLPSGLFPHKNNFGMVSALVMLLSLQLLLVDRRRWRNLLTLSLGLAAVFASQSALSLVLVGSGIGAILLLHMGRGSVLGRLLVIGAALLSAAAVAGALVLQQAGLYETILSLLGKSETLTGRTILWDYGWRQVMEKPLLGSGYLAFWHDGVNPDALYISGLVMPWQPGLLLPHFHNGYLQMLVDLGFIGMGLTTIVFLVFLAQAWGEHRRAETPVASWPLVLILFVLVSNAAEHGMFINHNLLTVYLLATLVSHELKRFRPRTLLVRTTAPVSPGIRP